MDPDARPLLANNVVMRNGVAGEFEKDPFSERSK
jgi:hypothetical protein